MTTVTAAIADDGPSGSAYLIIENHLLTCAHSIVVFVESAVEFVRLRLTSAVVESDLQIGLAQLERRIERAIERRVRALENRLVARDRQASRSSRRQFALSLLVSFPVSLLCAYLAFKIGWA